MDWDDLRFVIAVADGGSAVAAAAALGVNATTVQRRIARFEQQNAIHLFERRQSGFTPTPECEALLSASKDIEERILGIQREILGRDSRLEGRLAVTTTDTFMYASMARHLVAFRQQHPNIVVDVTLTNTRLNLSRQDADVAIRPSNNPPENLVGQRVSGLALAIYAHKDFAASLPKQPKMSQLKTLPWVGAGDALKGSLAWPWIKRTVPQSAIVLTVDTFAGVSTAVANGAGVGLMPCILGDPHPMLARLNQPIEELETSIWILTHPEIRSAAKIRAFMDFMTRSVRADKDQLEGKI